MKKILSIVLIGCVFISGLFAEWRVDSYKDDFGDPTDSYFIYYVPNDGTMSNSATVSSEAKIMIIIDMYKNSTYPRFSIDFRCHDYDWDSPIHSIDATDNDYSLVRTPDWKFKFGSKKIVEKCMGSSNWHKFYSYDSIDLLNNLINFETAKVAFYADGRGYNFSLKVDNLREALYSLGELNEYSITEMDAVFTTSDYLYNIFLEDLLFAFKDAESFEDSFLNYKVSSCIDDFVEVFGEDTFSNITKTIRENYKVEDWIYTFNLKVTEKNKDTFKLLGYNINELNQIKDTVNKDHMNRSGIARVNSNLLSIHSYNLGFGFTGKAITPIDDPSADSDAFDNRLSLNAGASIDYTHFWGNHGFNMMGGYDYTRETPLVNIGLGYRYSMLVNSKCECNIIADLIWLMHVNESAWNLAGAGLKLGVVYNVYFGHNFFLEVGADGLMHSLGIENLENNTSTTLCGFYLGLVVGMGVCF